MHFDVNVDGEITEENIEMNYEENYVRVTTPAHGLFQSMVLIHDYNEVQYIMYILFIFIIFATCFITWDCLNYNFAETKPVAHIFSGCNLIQNQWKMSCSERVC